MELRFTRSFEEDYRRLPLKLQRLIDKKLLLFISNPRYPSLQVKKMEGFDDIWEARVSLGYRFTFQRFDQIWLIRRVGPHDVLKNP